ncbi:MAG TPA: flagellar biosynthesis protein FlhF [Spirochaetes bacterium]|nr:flagellar biosynthesis protein FlhF [Spirochaetota bacterium]
MIYKTFKAPTYKEAVLMARIDMGNDVYIVGRKAVQEGGFLGMFTKKMTEITVARNEDIKNKIKSENKAVNPGSTSTSQAEKGIKENENTVLKELNEIKAKLNEIISPGGKQTESPYFERLIKALIEDDFPRDYIEKLRAEFEKELTLHEVNDPQILGKKCKDYIFKSIETSGPIAFGNGETAIIVLVGPTGVGKTTTIAKLAASYGVLQKNKVELFTIDSYRIAAIEQLGKYAELMQIPFTVINSREEFKSAVKNSNADLIFVDTAGKSQKNSLGLAELRSILDGVHTGLDIHLVISATTKHQDALDIMTRFNLLLYNKVIISKIDETNTMGPIFSIMNKEKKISYITTGQSVPDDIELAEKEKLLDMITVEGMCGG